MAKLQPRTLKGFRDFLPEQMVKRDYVISRIKKVFERHGFDPLETPSLEYWETLSGKYGEEGDRLIYRFTDRGGREVGLRYDLTVPLARVVAMYPQLPKPFKRYQIQPVWRAEKPQRGRYREFYQCDVDIVGSSSMLADAEILLVTYEALTELGFRNFRIRVNNRKVLRGVIEIAGEPPERELDIMRAIDKLDKIGLEGVMAELEERGVSAEARERIFGILEIRGTPEEVLQQARRVMETSAVAQEGLSELEELFGYLRALGIPETAYTLDLYLARGLDYYTGPIFETVVEEPRLGSITGGGRYDRLIGLFTGRDLPATGGSIGLERILDVMETLGMFPEGMKTKTQVLVTVFDEASLPYALQVTRLLRTEGVNTDLYLGNARLRGQLGYARDRGIPLVVIAGPDEAQENAVTLKDMRAARQEKVPLQDLPRRVQALLEGPTPQ